MPSDIDLFNLDQSGFDAAALSQSSLSDAQDLMGVAFDALPFPLLFHTNQGILYANTEAGTLFQLEPPALVGKHLLDHVATEDQVAVSTMLQTGLSHPKRKTSMEVLLAVGASERLCRITLVRLPWAGNPIIQLTIVDVTDQRRAEASLRQLTITDELTGAYNRRHAYYEGSLYTEAYKKDDSPFTVAAIDIDYFKKVNDTFGHAAGDQALIRLSRVAHNFLPTIRTSNSSMFARIGGEEFVLLLPGTPLTPAAAISDRFRRVVESMQIESGDVKFQITVSVGVSTMSSTDDSFETLLARADSALYCAKENGRNRVMNFADEDGI